MRSRAWLGLVAGVLASTTVGHAQPLAAGPLTDAAYQIAVRLAALSHPKRATVAAVGSDGSASQVYLSLGSADYLKPGTVFDLKQPGEPVVLDGRVLGHQETTVGEVVVERVTDDHLSVASVVRLAPGCEPAVGQRAYRRGLPRSVVVAPLARSDRLVPQLGEELAEQLELALGATGAFSVVERRRFDAVLAELKLGLSDMFDPTHAAGLGRQVQAQAVVIGSLVENDQTIDAVVRVVDLDTGRQLAGSLGTLSKTGLLLAKYQSAPGHPVVANAGTPSAEPPCCQDDPPATLVTPPPVAPASAYPSSAPATTDSPFAFNTTLEQPAPQPWFQPQPWAQASYNHYQTRLRQQLLAAALQQALARLGQPKAVACPPAAPHKRKYKDSCGQ